MALPARPGQQGAGPPYTDSLPGPLRRLTHPPSASPAPECAGPIPEEHAAQSWAEAAPRTRPPLRCHLWPYGQAPRLL
jgi:hypothetical protein